MLIFFPGAIVGVFLVLYTMLRSANLALQVMVALPMAFIGSVAALYISGQTLTVAAMVGFISLVWHRVPQRHPPDQPLPSFRPARR